MSLISKNNIVTGQTIQAEHVTRIIDALTESGSSEIIATGSFTGSFVGDGSGLINLTVPTASYALNSGLLGGYSSSYFATTGSNTFNGNQTINGDVTITGTASIAVLHVTYESASVIYSSGSNQLGDATNDTQTLIGTVVVSGSLNVTGSVNIPNITGSLLGTSSFAVSASYSQTATSASYALNSETASFSSTASFITASNVYGPAGANSILSASYAASASYVIGGVDPFPYTGSAQITGSLGVTGSTNVTRLGIGAIGSTSIPLDVRAQGALTTDTVFRIRTSANSADLLTISGLGDLTFGSGSAVANGGTPGIAIGNNAAADSQFGSYPVALGYRANSKGNSVAIGPNSTAGNNGLFTNVAIGYNANAAGSSGFGIGAMALGSNTTAGSGGGNGISVGASIFDGGGTSNIILGRFFNGVSFTAGAFAFGSGVSDASRASLDIGNSFSVYINQNTRALFLNQKSNLVFKNGQSIASGTNFDANATNTITLSSGSAPTTNIIDSVQFYVADITPGTASAHFRNEPGHIVKLYTQPAVTSSQGIADVLTNLGLLTGSSTIVTDTASFATTASYALQAISASYAPTNYGPYGIPNSSGSYTFYTGLSASIASATSGQTVEQFADVTETSSVSIIWKDGVNFNGNGHTYNHTYSAGDSNTINIPSSAVTCTINNWRVIRSGRSNGTSTDYTFNVIPGGFSNNASRITFNNVYIESTYGTAVYISAGAGLYKGTLYGKGYLYGIFAHSEIQDMTGESTVSSPGIYIGNGHSLYNCKGISVSGYGIHNNGGNRLVNSTGISTSNVGLYGGSHYNCTGVSTSGTGGVGGAYNSIYISTSGVAGDGIQGANNTLISSTNYGWYTFFPGYKLTNSTIISTSNLAAYIRGAILKNCVIRSEYNNSAGHAISEWFNDSVSKIISCDLEVANASAYCIASPAGPLSMKIANCSYDGSTIPVQSNITQTLSSTQDNQGNILL